MRKQLLGLSLFAVLLSGCGSDGEPLHAEKSFDPEQFRVVVASQTDDDQFFEESDAFKSASTISYQYKLSELASYGEYELGPDKNPLTQYDWRILDAAFIWQPHNDRLKSKSWTGTIYARYWRAYEVFTEVEGESYRFDLPLSADYGVPSYANMISSVMIDRGEVIVSYPEKIKSKLTEAAVHRATNELVGGILRKMNGDRNLRIEKAKLASREL